MELIKYPENQTWTELLKRPSIDTTSLEATVQSVLSDIKANGQSAVNKYTLQFDKVTISNVLVSNSEFIEAEKQISKELKQAIQLAKKNIETFHSAQKEEVKIIEKLKAEGAQGILVVPIEKMIL